VSVTVFPVSVFVRWPPPDRLQSVQSVPGDLQQGGGNVSRSTAVELPKFTVNPVIYCAVLQLPSASGLVVSVAAAATY
jgi:hypothetical protein